MPRAPHPSNAGALGRTAAVVALLLAGCATEPRRPAPPTATAPIPITPPAERAAAPVVRVPVEPAPVTTQAPPATAAAAIAANLPFPANVLYMCVTGQGGQRKQTAIEFVPKVLELCRRHPEMGPCQYERNVCRSAGGRVFAPDGKEITMTTEAEYDKRVLRVRFRGD